MTAVLICNHIRVIKLTANGNGLLNSVHPIPLTIHLSPSLPNAPVPCTKNGTENDGNNTCCSDKGVVCANREKTQAARHHRGPDSHVSGGSSKLRTERGGGGVANPNHLTFTYKTRKRKHRIQQF